MKFRVRYARTVYLETIVEADSEDEIKDDGSLPSVYTDIPTEMIPAAVNRVEDYDWCWEVNPAWDQMPEELVDRLTAEDKLGDAAEVFELGWEDDYVLAAAQRGDPSFSILDFAREIISGALESHSGEESAEMEQVLTLIGKK